MGVDLTKRMSSIAETEEKTKDFFLENANGQKSIAESTVKTFLDYIGDTKHKLENKVIKGTFRDVLLILVNDFQFDSFKILTVCFCKANKCVTEVKMFNIRDISKIEAYVGNKVWGGHLGEIANECHSKSCEYSLKDGVIYLSDGENFFSEKVADLNHYAANKTIEIFDKVAKEGIDIRKMEIDGVEYKAILKEKADRLLGDERNSVYAVLSTLQFIYVRKESGKIRYSYRERKKDSDGEMQSVEFFAVNMKKLQMEIRQEGNKCA